MIGEPISIKNHKVNHKDLGYLSGKHFRIALPTFGHVKIYIFGILSARKRDRFKSYIFEPSYGPYSPIHFSLSDVRNLEMPVGQNESQWIINLGPEPPPRKSYNKKKQSGNKTNIRYKNRSQVG